MKHIMILSMALLIGCTGASNDKRIYGDDGMAAEAVRLSSGEYGVQLCYKFNRCTLTGYHFLNKEDAIATRDRFRAQQPKAIEVVE